MQILLIYCENIVNRLGKYFNTVQILCKYLQTLCKYLHKSCKYCTNFVKKFINYCPNTGCPTKKFTSLKIFSGFLQENSCQNLEE